MSTTFARSSRMLAADRYGRINWALLVAAGFVIAWLAWFFLARVSLYEVSRQAQLQDSSQIVAYFPPAALTHIRPGQPAQLRLDDFLWTEYGTVAATVVRVDDEISNGQVEVALTIPAGTATTIPLQRGLAGQVEVETGQIAPVDLFLNRVESWLATARPEQEEERGE
jgi:hypothetical protein